MKKTLAIVLALVLAVSCSCVIFASAEESVNLAKGIKTNVVGYGDYKGDLTDGSSETEIKTTAKWFAFYYNTKDGKPMEGSNVEVVPAQGDTPEKHIGNVVLDLGETCTIDKVSVNLFTGNKWGIVAPKSVTVAVSDDSKTYTEVQTKTYKKVEKTDNKDIDIVSKEDFAGAAAVTARYVRVSIELNGVFAFLDEIEVWGVKGVRQPTPDESSAAEYTESIAANVKKVENAKINVKLDSKLEGDNVVVTFTVEEVAADTEIITFEADLYYDAEKVELDKGEDANTLPSIGKIVKAPAAWKVTDYLTTPSKDHENAIHIAFGAGDSNDMITKDAPLVLTFTFKLKENATMAGFWVDSDSIDTRNQAVEKNNYPAEGAYTVAKVATTPAVSSDAESSAASSTAPKPGDNGIIVFTILGIIAVAGAAVVVKVRH